MFGIVCVCVVSRPHSVKLRSAIVIMFWIEVVLLIISLLLLVIFIIFLEDIYDCDNFSGTSCDTYKTIFYVVLAIQVTIGVTLDVMIGQIVINGKKEQIEYNKKEGKKASQPQQPQQPMQPMQPGQQMYPTMPQQ